VRWFLVATLAFWLTGEAGAACVCRCVDGEMQPLCSSSVDLPPVCAAVVCPLVPPSVTPVERPMVPPVGTSQCSQREVLDPATNRYAWRSICD